MAEHLLPCLSLHFVLQFQGRGLKPADGVGGDFHRSALRHSKQGDDVVGVDVGEEDELDPATPHDTQGEDEGGESDGDGNVTPLEGALQERCVDVVDEALQSAGECVLDSGPPPLSSGSRIVTADPGVSKVRWENENRFDEREDEGTNLIFGLAGALWREVVVER